MPDIFNEVRKFDGEEPSNELRELIFPLKSPSTSALRQLIERLLKEEKIYKCTTKHDETTEPKTYEIKVLTPLNLIKDVRDQIADRIKKDSR